MKTIFVFAIGSIVFLPNLVAQQASPAKAIQPVGFPASQIAVMQERQSAVMGFKQNLDNAKTPEEKRAVIDQWRQQNQAFMSQRPPAKSQQQALAELKAKAAGNPEMSRCVEQMAQRLEAVETLKTTSSALANAKGNEKEKLQQDMHKARENLSKIQQDQMASMKTEQAVRQRAEAVRPQQKVTRRRRNREPPVHI
jgi:hypothetical protein